MADLQTSTQAAAAAALHCATQVVQLHKNLSSLVKSKGPFDPHVRRLRTAIRDNYEALILRDHGSPESVEMEQALWRLHYHGIEEFRFRIRKLSAEFVSQPVRNRGRKRNREEPLIRVVTALKAFVGEASGFFHGLIIKLRLKYGLSSTFSDGDRLTNESSGEVRACLTSCYRLLIYLGDLARYKELYGVSCGKARDWTVALNYYRQAALLWPSNGNSYNQLAVLYTYSGDELISLYYYCRSVVADVPFATARDNLLLLFQKNQHQIAQKIFLDECEMDDNSAVRDAETHLPKSTSSIEQEVMVKQSSVNGALHLKEYHKYFELHFIRLVGILFKRSSMEELQEVINSLERGLQHLTFAGLMVAFETKRSCRLWDNIGSVPCAMQIVVILIFSLHCLGFKPSDSDFSSWKSPESSMRSAMEFALKFICLQMQESANFLVGGNSVLPYTVIFMEWLADCLDNLVECDVWLVDTFSKYIEHVDRLESLILEKGMAAGAASLQHENHAMKASIVAQWEDHELFGYIPLSHFHLNVDFSNQVNSRGVNEIQTHNIWMQRFHAASKSLRCFLSNGTCYSPLLTVRLKDDLINDDSTSGRFVLADKINQSTNSTEEPFLGGNPMLSLKDWTKGNSIPLPALNSTEEPFLGGNPMLSLKDWTKGNSIPLPALPSMLKKLENSNVGEAILHSGTNPSLSCDLECDMTFHTTNVVSESTILPKFIQPPPPPSFLRELHLCTDHALVHSSPCGQQSAHLMHQERTNDTSLRMGDGSIVAGLTISEGVEWGKNIRESGGMVLKVAGVSNKLTGVRLPTADSVHSPIFTDRSMEDSRWFDGYTHVKPEQCGKAVEVSKSKSFTDLTVKNEAQCLTNKNSPCLLGKVQFWSTRCYESQNPFLRWMEKCASF